jgi:hypothetical protein
MNWDIPNLTVSGIAIVLSFVAYRASVHQNRLSASSVGADWIRDLREWASEAVDVLAEASYTCTEDAVDNAGQADEHHRCRCKLSALIDRGRFLLPNERDGEYGSHKPRAYRGLRHQALDALVAAEQILARSIPLETFRSRKDALVGVRREFVSIVQGIIDPISYNRDVAKILRMASDRRSKDPTLGGLLPDAAVMPTGAAGIMEAASKRNEAIQPASHTRTHSGIVTPDDGASRAKRSKAT